MQLTFDNELDENVYFTEEEESLVVEEEEVQTEWLGKILNPIQKVLSQDVPPLVKIVAVALIAVLALIAIALASSAIYAFLIPFMASLPLTGWPLFLVIMAILALMLLAFLLVKGWSWVKDLPKGKKNKVITDVQSVATTLWAEGKRLIEF